MCFLKNMRCNMCKELFFVLFSLPFIAQGKQPSLIWFQNTTNNYFETSLDNATAVMNTSYYNNNQSVFCYTTGFAMRANSTKVLSVIQTILDLKDILVCLLQWDDQANTYLNSVLDPAGVTSIGINYPVVTQELKKVAKDAGQAFCALQKAGLDLNKVHLVGVSLGAHLWGNAAREITICTGGMLVSRITALDAAGPSYQQPFDVNTGIGPDCAQFVSVIHTDPDGYGNKNKLGHVDFWPNVEYYNKYRRQPGCPALAAPLTPDGFCSHEFGVELFKDAARNRTGLEASKAENIEQWTNGNQTLKTYFGDLTDRSYNGTFFLCTNSTSPYGKGEDGLDPAKCPK